MANGYWNRILRVDLTTGKMEVEEPGDAFFRKYVGGSALALYYLLKEMPAGADPLGPENILVLSVGPITGTPISGNSRVMANAKSPHTGAIGDAQGGGFWPAEFKFAQFDAIVIKGKAPRPVYLWLHDGQAELRDASHLWGKETGPTEDMIQEELGDKKIQVLQIGPGGEKMVKYACIINSKNRANGRTGMGAVMGSKNLKAVACRGKAKVGITNREMFQEVVKKGAQDYKNGVEAAMTALGTANNVAFMMQTNGLPTRNWSSGIMDNWEAISGEVMAETILKENDTCHACIIRCKRVVEIKDGPFPVDPQYGGPEYETLSTFGSYCGVDNLAAVSKANEICNRYGLDTIGTGAAVAFAMDCYEHGILTKEDAGGLELKFGNAEAMVKLTEMIANREGLGDLLAEGTDAAAKEIGKGAEQYSVCCKGSPFPAHMPAFKRSLGLVYAVNPYGADHQTSEHDHGYAPGYASPEQLRRMSLLGLVSPQPVPSLNTEKVRFALVTQSNYHLLNCAGTCQFVFGGTWQLYDVDDLVKTINAITGWNTTLYEMMKVGERSLVMMRAFNAREGIARTQDKLPPKSFIGLKGGTTDGFAVGKEEFETALNEYYAMANWDDNGVPTRGKFLELDLAWVADLIGV
jgi:aldehyde:ferredoxin oxidoreductase